jgi:hypothetical protein
MMSKHGRAHHTAQQHEHAKNKRLLRQHVKVYNKSERQQRYERRLMSKQMEHMKHLLKKYGDPYYSHVREDNFIGFSI